MDNCASHKAVRIVEIVKGENEQLKYQLKFDEFEKIFDAVRNVPVAIISIAGECRGGKSFMMTLLANYLLSEGWGNENIDKLTEVFEHKGGTDGHTDGIYVTRKPFMLKTNDEKDVAVFLMDTEGMFDNKTTANDNSIIFAWSTLLSSVQIYNIDKIIKENDLRHLQLFTDFTHCVSNKKRNVSTSSLDIAVNHPFQELLFLCRNWEQPDYDDGFKGGSKYLKKVMIVDNEDNKLVRQRLTDSFSHVSCSLMPHPGKSIARRGRKNSKAVCFSDMDEDFSLEVGAFAKYLFGKENLVAKKLNGRELTGEAIIDLAREYARILDSGEMPQIKNLVKSNENIEFLLRIKDIESNYKASMQAQMGERPLLPEDLKELHLQCFSKAKDLFQMHNILEDEAERQKYLDEMERNIGIIFQSLSKNNEAKIARIMMMIDGYIINAGRVYYESLIEFAAGCWVEDIRKAKDHATKKANVWFQERMSDLERQWSSENTLKALQLTFDSKQMQFETKNASRKEVFVAQMSQLPLEAMHKYQNLMELAVQRNDDMEKVHEKSKSCAIAFFNDSNIGKYTNYKEEKKLKLELKLSEELKKYQKLYEKTMDGELRNALAQAKQIYLQHIHEMDQYVMETELESTHVKAVNMAMEVATSVSALGDGFVQKCKEKVAEIILFEKQNWISRNELLKGQEENRLARQRQFLEDQYNSEYTDFKETYVDDAKLQEIHDKALQRAITGLSHYETKHTEALKTNRKELEKNIKETFQIVKQMNAENRRLICSKLFTFQTLLETDYFDKMYEVTRKRYAKINMLNKMHATFKAAVIREVKPLIPFSDIFEETIEFSFRKLDANFEKVIADKTDWGEIFKNAQVVFGAIASVSTLFGPTGLIVGLVATGVVAVAGGFAALYLLRPVEDTIDVSELKSILYLKELKLVANQIN